MAAAKTSTARRSRSTQTAKADTPPVDPKFAALLALTDGDVAKATALAAVMGVDPPAITEPEPAGVDSTDGYVAPKGQPTLSDPDKLASIPQKRLWLDLRVREMALPKSGRKTPTALPANVVKALAEYEKALHLALVAVGVKGAATVTMGDAQPEITRLKAVTAKRKS